MILWTVKIGHHDNGWDGYMRIICPTSKAAKQVMAKLKKAKKAGQEPAGFSGCVDELRTFDHIHIEKTEIDVAGLSKKEMACACAHALFNDPAGCGIVGTETWQTILATPDLVPDRPASDGCPALERLLRF